MADLGTQASQATDAAARQATSAIAQSGSAGLKAYQDAQGQLGAAKAAAIQQATQRSGLIGGPEANVANYSAPINNVYNAASAKLAANQGAFSGLEKSLGAANQNYFNQVKAAIPLAQAYAQAQAAAKAPKPTATDKENQIVGSANADLQKAQQQNQDAVSAHDKAVSDLTTQVAQKQAQQKQLGEQLRFDLQSQQMYTQKGQPVPQALRDSIKNQVNQFNQLGTDVNNLNTQKTNFAPAQQAPTDVAQYAQQEAQRLGYTPEQSQAMYNTSNRNVLDKIVAANPHVQEVDAQMAKDITTGAIKYQDTFKAKIAQIAQVDPNAADYLARKYGSQVAARPKVAKSGTKYVTGG